MGFRLSSFLGGAAEEVVKTMESREKDARDTGLLAGKSLYAQYAAIKKENAELSAEIKDNLDTVKAYFPKMDDKTAMVISSKKSVMGAITEMIKKGEVDPNTVDLDLFRTFAQNNVPAVAIEKMTDAAAVGKLARDRFAAEDVNKETDAALAEKKPKGLMESYYEGFAEKGTREYAASVGVTPEQMRGVKRMADQPVDTSITFDMSQLRPAEKYDALKDKAQVAFVEATQKGDAAAIAKAANELSAFTAMTNSQQSEVVKATELRAKLDRVASEGGPEAVEAKKKIKVLDELKRTSNVATSIPKGDGDGTKPFSFPNLKSAISTAIAVEMNQQFGQQLKDNVAWVLDPSTNSLDSKFIGSDPELRKQFNDITRDTAERILKGLNPSDQNVQMMRKIYSSSSEPTATPTATPTAAPAARGGGLGGRAVAPSTVAAPSSPTLLPTPRPADVPSGWTLKVDAKGNKAYVSPDGKSFKEVK